MTDLSVVIPAFDEARRLGDSLPEIARSLGTMGLTAEIILVDDGSRDGTLELVKRIGPELGVPVRAIRYSRNRGKGHALKVGFEAARGARILFTDSDLSTNFGCAGRLLDALDDSEIAIGSRHMEGATISEHQPALRQALGSVFTALVRAVIADVSDATCGFKAFRAEAGKELFSKIRVYDWSFDAELLFLARRAGHRITEVPVEWHDETGTKVRLARDVLGSLLGLARIRWNGLRGVYRQAFPITEPLEHWESS